MSRLEPIPDAENSALLVLEIAKELVDLAGPRLEGLPAPLAALAAGAGGCARAPSRSAALALAGRPVPGEPWRRPGDSPRMPAGRYPEARPVVTTLERVPKTNFLRTIPRLSAREESALQLADFLSRAIFLAPRTAMSEGPSS